MDMCDSSFLERPEADLIGSFSTFNHQYQQSTSSEEGCDQQHLNNSAKKLNLSSFNHSECTPPQCLTQFPAPHSVRTRAMTSTSTSTSNVLLDSPISESINSLFPLMIPIPQIVNIVSSVTLGCWLDLKNIARRSENATYNPRRNGSVIMKIKNPYTTAIIFRTGKIICTGAKNEIESSIAVRKFVKIIQKLGYRIRYFEFKIQNIVGSCEVRFQINLELLAIAYAKFSKYEPELFPGLVYNMENPNVLLLIFQYGKIVITGTKERIDIYCAFNKIYPIL
ncbi:TATA-box-binding protein-like [Centruroides sculpturatus]|uniref:TATA-box-binding protein-like n=1 Tax=Centruroides sculpturatus TaxID=218467 RepID=UPI000C6EFE2F|nr:TATA-box-binding protein-like [Centruroides sculpturatus]